MSDDTITEVLLLSDVRGTNALLRHRVTVESNNWTLIEFNSPDEAAEVVKLMAQSNMTLLHAHWTSGESILCSFSQKLIFLY